MAQLERQQEKRINPPPIPRGMVRIYFYRCYEPYETTSRPWIYLNRQEALTSVPGKLIWRDVPPGDYEVYVASVGILPKQYKHTVLHAGDRRYVRIDSARHGYGSRHDLEMLIAVFISEEKAREEIDELICGKSTEKTNDTGAARSLKGTVYHGPVTTVARVAACAGSPELFRRPNGPLSGCRGATARRDRPRPHLLPPRQRTL